MTLTEFVRTECENLEQFADAWLRSRIAHPSNFPRDLAPGEWDEQYAEFKDSETAA